MYKKEIRNTHPQWAKYKNVGLIIFLRMRKGLGNSGQHICCANASHKWLSACLGGVMFPNWNPQSEFISDEEKQEFPGFLADGTQHPEETGAAKLTLHCKVLEQCFILPFVRQSLK